MALVKGKVIILNKGFYIEYGLDSVRICPAYSDVVTVKDVRNVSW